MQFLSSVFVFQFSAGYPDTNNSLSSGRLPAARARTGFPQPAMNSHPIPMKFQ
jgi:hypothetical protein